MRKHCGLCLAAMQQLACVPMLTSVLLAGYVLGSQGCSCSEVMQKGACIRILGTCSSWSWLLETGCFTFWFTLEVEYDPGERVLQFGGFCFWWARAYQRCWGVCCVTSVVMGCDTQQEISFMTQLLLLPCYILTEALFDSFASVFIRRSKCEMTKSILIPCWW